MSIYAYWEGNERHWFYDLCWGTVVEHNPNAVLLTPEKVEEIVGELPKAVKEAYVTHRCDWIRKEVIHTLGGVWLDMDYICWSDLSILGSMSQDYEFVGYKEQELYWMDNFFAGKKGSVILKTAANYALSAMESKGKGIRWLEASKCAIEHAIKKHPRRMYIKLPTHVVSPVPSTKRAFFVGKRTDQRVSNFKSYGCMASMHVLRRRGSEGNWTFPFSSSEELLSSPTGLGALLRRAKHLAPLPSTIHSPVCN